VPERRPPRRQPPHVYRRRRAVFGAALFASVGLLVSPFLGDGLFAAVTSLGDDPAGDVRDPSDDPAPRPQGEGTAGGDAAAQDDASAGASSPPASGSSPDALSARQPSAQPTTVPTSGSGVLVGIAQPAGPTVDTGRAVRYAVEVEEGVPVAGTAFAEEVHAILTHPLGWQGVDAVAFERVPAGEDRDLIVTLASPDLTDQLCAPLMTGGELSCRNGQRAVINAKRWVLGAETFGDALVEYRSYLISHEVGHFLGHGHVRCRAPGAPAPVMAQQTKSLQGCAPNPWPAAG
jgi:hypothetical protein